MFMKPRVRELLGATPFQPFLIRMADGREYRIEHSDFVLASSSDVSEILVEELNGRMHFLAPHLVTSVERFGATANGASQGT